MQRTPTPPSGATSQLLTERYGGAPRWSRALGLAAVVVLTVAGIAWVVWAAASWSSAVRAELQAYQIASGHRVTVTVTVHRQDGAAVRCEVYAQAPDHTIVGESTFQIPAGDARTVTVAHDVTTERPAVAAVLRSCDRATR